VRLKAVGVTAPALLGDFLTEQFQKPAAIVVIKKDVGPRVAGGSQMLQRAGIFQT